MMTQQSSGSNGLQSQVPAGLMPVSILEQQAIIERNLAKWRVEARERRQRQEYRDAKAARRFNPVMVANGKAVVQ